MELFDLFAFLELQYVCVFSIFAVIALFEKIKKRTYGDGTSKLE